ncbi:hypothetical protein FQN60_009255, partial [Etheostoma spectabile]
VCVDILPQYVEESEDVGAVLRIAKKKKSKQRACTAREITMWGQHSQREEKQLEAAVESLFSRVAHVKNALHSFIYKLENEYERLTWPSVLDNFALLSGQLNTINKLLKNEKTPFFATKL